MLAPRLIFNYDDADPGRLPGDSDERESRGLMADFALLNIADDGEALPAIKVAEQILPVDAALAAAGKAAPFPTRSTKEILAAWPQAEPELSALAEAFAKGSSGQLRAVARPLHPYKSWRRSSIPMRSSALSPTTPII